MKLLPVLLLVVLCSGCPKGGDLPSPAPSPVTVRVEWKQYTDPLEPISEPKLAAFYFDFAELLERDVDSKIIATTGVFRQTNMAAGQLAFQKTGLQGKYPQLSFDLTAAFNAAIGTKDGPLDRNAAIEMLRAVGKALQ